MLVRIVGSLVAIAALAACQKMLSETPMRPLATLAGTEWGPMQGELDQFVGFKLGGDVIGSGGCNNFFGSFTQNGRTVTFGPLASTKMACPPEIMTAERNFMRLLGQVRAVEATHRELTLFGEGDQLLTVLRRRDWD